MLRKLELGGDDGKFILARGHSREALLTPNRTGEIAAMFGLHLGLVVEEIQLGGAAGLEKIDNALCPRRHMGVAEHAPSCRGCIVDRRIPLFLHQACEGRRTDTGRGPSEKLAARDVLQILVRDVHGKISRMSVGFHYSPIMNKIIAKMVPTKGITTVRAATGR